MVSGNSVAIATDWDPATTPGAGCAGQMPESSFHREGDMYEKPKVERFGSFRELTLVGLWDDGDGGIIWGIGDGCAIGCGSKGGSRS